MTTKKELLRAIRTHCLNCCSGSYSDVKECASGPDAAPYSACAMWPFRLGTDPDEPSEAMKEKGRKCAEGRMVMMGKVNVSQSQKACSCAKT